MTREECIALLERYAEYHGMGIPNLAGCREAMKMAADLLSQPSLPSDLDEAAHSYSESDEPLYSPGHRFHWDNESLFGKQIETTFKAGAEWQASQGASYETVISADKTIPVLPMKDVSEMGFDYGDKVVVQIRKK